MVSKRLVNVSNGLICLIVLVLSFTACNKSKRIIASDEEEAVFELVYQPGAEGRYPDAIAVSDSLLANLSMSDTLRTYIMIERLVALVNLGNLDASVAFADTLADFGRRSGIGEAVMQAMEAKGLSARRRGNYEDAIKYYTEGLKVARDEGNIEMEQTLSDVIGVAYTEIGRVDEALEFERRALSLAEEMADTTAMISTAASIGACYARDDKWHEAIEYLRPYSGIAEQMAPTMRVKFLTPLVKAYLALDSIPQAERTIAKMEEAVEGLPLRHQAVGVVLSAKSMLLSKEKRFREQWELYEMIDTLGSHGKAPDIVLTERAECLANMKDYRGAYGKMRQAYEALDSIRRSDIDNDLSELSVRYDTLNKELEIERLTARQRAFAAIAVGCVFVVVIVILLAVNMRRRQRLRLEREKHLQYIRGLEAERARMARELHDDVAGELVGVQLALDSLSPDEQSARLLEIAGRVRSLSHELMPPQFGESNLTALLVDYVRRINELHGTSLVELTDEGSYDWASLSPQRCYELYRIVQEAVNNAMKHASPTHITIRLDGDERFSLTVVNDGVDPASRMASGGIGMQTIRSRAGILDADITTSLQDCKFTLSINQR